MIRNYRKIGSTNVSYINSLGSGKSQGGEKTEPLPYRNKTIKAIAPMPTYYHVTGILDGNKNVRMNVNDFMPVASFNFEIHEPELPYDGFCIVDNYNMNFNNVVSQQVAYDFIEGKISLGYYVFKVITISGYWYLVASNGTYINVSGGIVESDGVMYTCDTGNTNRQRGYSIDWSSYLPVEITESYNHV